MSRPVRGHYLALPDRLAGRVHGFFARANGRAPALELDVETALLVLISQALDRIDEEGIDVDEVLARLADLSADGPLE